MEKPDNIVRFENAAHDALDAAFIHGWTTAEANSVVAELMGVYNVSEYDLQTHKIGL